MSAPICGHATPPWDASQQKYICSLCKSGGPFEQAFLCTWKHQNAAHYWTICSDRCLDKFKKESLKAVDSGSEVKTARRVARDLKIYGKIACPKCFCDMQDVTPPACGSSEAPVNSEPVVPPPPKRAIAAAPPSPTDMADVGLDQCFVHHKEKEDEVLESGGSKKQGKSKKKNGQRGKDITHILFGEGDGNIIPDRKSSLDEGDASRAAKVVPKSPAASPAPSPSLVASTAAKSSAIAAVPMRPAFKEPEPVRSNVPVKPVKVAMDKLPLGWKAARDLGSGDLYYYHTSGEVTWDCPFAEESEDEDEDEANEADAEPFKFPDIRSALTAEKQVKDDQALARRLARGGEILLTSTPSSPTVAASPSPLAPAGFAVASSAGYAVSSKMQSHAGYAASPETSVEDKLEPATATATGSFPQSAETMPTQSSSEQVALPGRWRSGFTYGFLCIRTWLPPPEDMNCIQVTCGDRAALLDEVNGWVRCRLLLEDGEPERIGHIPRWALSPTTIRAPAPLARGVVCLARRNFEVTSEGYLSFKSGDRLVCLSHKPPYVWLYAEHANDQQLRGWIPEAFLQQLERLASVDQ